jgi:hypothetical protein
VLADMAGNEYSACQRVRQASDASPLQSLPTNTKNHAGKNLALSETEESATVSNVSRHPRCRSVTTSWDPYFLSWTLRTGFILLFLLMIVSLEVLAWYSRTHNGLATSNSNKHYLWTYGPTAGKETRVVNVVLPTRTSPCSLGSPLATS